MNDYRVEKDSVGEIKVPAEKLWGAQTQRSLQNFEIGIEKMPIEIISAFAILKKAAALTNAELGVMDPTVAEKISAVCDDILAGKLNGEFPLAVWQTGSGTQTNMNVNEVIAHITNLHPNDDVNKGQSSNDTFPTAMHIAVTMATTQSLLPSLLKFAKTLGDLSNETMSIIKIGRTHLQDATPLRLGQEIGAWSAMIKRSHDNISNFLSDGGLQELALGGTAVGTGLNTHPEFAERSASKITEITGVKFITGKDKFEALTSKNALAGFHGLLKALSADLMKIANDVRWLASGPRCGLGELSIPENEPGSSIMPGKVNPTQAEALTMVCTQVMGNDVTVGIAASQGSLQLNTYMPVIAYNVLQSTRILADAITSFDKNCASGIRPNGKVIKRHLEDSLMLVTALSPKIGYNRAAEVARKAHKEGKTLKDVVLAEEIMSEVEFDELTHPERMV